jgi:diguanylate cyclase (GGDEF)-like protein
VPELPSLRADIVRLFAERHDQIVNDALTVFPFAAEPAFDANDSRRLCDVTLRLLTASVAEGVLDPRHAAVADLAMSARSCGVVAQQLFGLTYLLERTALDEAALDETLGATSEQWPAVAQAVRRASFDSLASLADRMLQDTTGGIVDRLTTLHSRAVFDVALDKEIHRAERFGHPFALVLLDVDRLSELNAAHGYGFGERVLERIGIVIKNYFREHDWVVRHGEDSFAVLLPETAPAQAEMLAEQVRAMVEERLLLRDHRTDEAVQVTVSVAYVVLQAVNARITAEQVLLQAEQAVHRAKHAGRNRIERVDLKVEPDVSETKRRGTETQSFS